MQRVFVNDVEGGEAFATTVDAAQNWVGQGHVNLTAQDPDGSGTAYPPVGTATATGIVKAWKFFNATGTLYLHSPSGNPNTNGAKIEVLKSAPSSAVKIGNQSHVYLDRLMISGGNTVVVDINPTGTYAGTNLRVTNCVIKSARSEGIRVWVDSTAAQTNGVIKWNIVSSGQGPNTKPCADNALYAFGNEPYPGEGSGAYNGVTLYSGCQNWVVAQNNVSNFWHTQISAAQRVLGKAGCQNNLVELFTDYTAGDLTLQSTSPARGARKDISAILPESPTWTDIGCWQIP